MKSIKLIPAFIFLLVCCISCSIDDGVDEGPSVNFAVIGLWDLAEVNVNPPQDLDMDGNASTNLMDELDCISGSLLIDGNFIWTFEQTELTITTITGDQFSVVCNGTVSGTGNWLSSQTEVTFTGNDVLTSLTISGEQLIDDIGMDLPEIESFVYERRPQ
ncbi:MAG: hypothetical protein AAGC43_04810 [Bacteroidota bacterium]